MNFWYFSKNVYKILKGSKLLNGYKRNVFQVLLDETP